MNPQDQLAAIAGRLEQLGERFTEYAATTRGLAVNDVVYATTILFDSTGRAQVSAQVPIAALVVDNLGTLDCVVNSVGMQGSPSLSGTGVAMVAPRSRATLYLVGSVHSFYGRPGERIIVTAFSRPIPPAASSLGPAPWQTVAAPLNAGLWASGGFYTTPWGTAAVFGGFTARETAGVAAQFRVHENDVNGLVLDTVQMAAGTSMEIELDHGKRAPTGGSTLFLELVAGSIEGTLLVR